MFDDLEKTAVMPGQERIYAFAVAVFDKENVQREICEPSIILSGILTIKFNKNAATSITVVERDLKTAELTGNEWTAYYSPENLHKVTQTQGSGYVDISHLLADLIEELPEEVLHFKGQRLMVPDDAARAKNLTFSDGKDDQEACRPFYEAISKYLSKFCPELSEFEDVADNKLSFAAMALIRIQNPAIN